MRDEDGGRKLEERRCGVLTAFQPLEKWRRSKGLTTSPQSCGEKFPPQELVENFDRKEVVLDEEFLQPFMVNPSG